MDSRIALQANEKLTFLDDASFTIIKELARGGSSIVYDAFYYDHANDRKYVRIKECYPFKCHIRRIGQMLEPVMSDQLMFDQTKQRLKKAYRLGNTFLSVDGLINATSNTYNIYEHNNTIYIIFSLGDCETR